MRVLLDECVPRKLKRSLAAHDVFTATEQGWTGVTNGKLLALAAAEFEVFLTVDQNVTFQQNIASFEIGVVVLVTRSIRLKDLLPLVPEMLLAVQTIEPGEFVRIG